MLITLELVECSAVNLHNVQRHCCAVSVMGQSGGPSISKTSENRERDISMYVNLEMPPFSVLRQLLYDQQRSRGGDGTLHRLVITVSNNSPFFRDTNLKI